MRKEAEAGQKNERTLSDKRVIVKKEKDIEYLWLNKGQARLQLNSQEKLHED